MTDTSSPPTWTMEEYPHTIAVVNPHPDSDSGYMIIRKADLRPEHVLFGPEGRGYPPDHVPPTPDPLVRRGPGRPPKIAQYQASPSVEG